MKNLILVLGIVLGASSLANGTNEGINPRTASQKMQNWIASHAEYPAEAFNNKEEGTVYIAFTVSDNGILENVAIAQGISKNLDQAALDLVLEMPVSELLAGSEKYDTTYIVPIKFVIK